MTESEVDQPLREDPPHLAAAPEEASAEGGADAVPVKRKRGRPPGSSAARNAAATAVLLQNDHANTPYMQTRSRDPVSAAVLAAKSQLRESTSADTERPRKKSRTSSHFLKQEEEAPLVDVDVTADANGISHMVAGGTDAGTSGSTSVKRPRSRTTNESQLAKDEVDDYDYDDVPEGSVTRCVCNCLDDDGVMIQCDKCELWLHSGCVGLGHDENNVPEEYQCPFCSELPLPFVPIDPPPLIASLIVRQSTPNASSVVEPEKQGKRFNEAMLHPEQNPDAVLEISTMPNWTDKMHMYVAKPSAAPYFRSNGVDTALQTNYQEISDALDNVASLMNIVDGLEDLTSSAIPLNDLSQLASTIAVVESRIAGISDL